MYQYITFIILYFCILASRKEEEEVKRIELLLRIVIGYYIKRKLPERRVKPMYQKIPNIPVEREKLDSNLMLAFPFLYFIKYYIDIVHRHYLIYYIK